MYLRTTLLGIGDIDKAVLVSFLILYLFNFHVSTGTEKRGGVLFAIVYANMG